MTETDVQTTEIAIPNYLIWKSNQLFVITAWRNETRNRLPVRSTIGVGGQYKLINDISSHSAFMQNRTIKIISFFGANGQCWLNHHLPVYSYIELVVTKMT